MRSNFDSPLRLEDGVVEACGELDWESGEHEAHVTITITQKDEKVVGSATSPPNFESGEDEWMLSVRPAVGNRKFKKGRAHAVGLIHTVADDGIATFSWEQDVDLDPNAGGDS